MNEEIISADGHNIRYTKVVNGSDFLVVMTHGIATNKDEDGIYTRFAEELLAPKFDSIRFDFRGHGDSEILSSHATVAGELLDLMAVMRWARKQRYKKIFHLSTSFGSSVTLLALSQFSFSDVAALVFWNPVFSYRNTFIEPKVEWAKEFFDQSCVEDLAYRTGTAIPDSGFVIELELT